jgi:hypothetical protein
VTFDSRLLSRGRIHLAGTCKSDDRRENDALRFDYSAFRKLPATSRQDLEFRMRFFESQKGQNSQVGSETDETSKNRPLCNSTKLTESDVPESVVNFPGYLKGLAGTSILAANQISRRRRPGLRHIPARDCRHFSFRSYHLGSLQLFASSKDGSTISFPQIFFPARFGWSLKFSFLSWKYRSIASLHSLADW